jgi:hypothetical protein
MFKIFNKKIIKPFILVNINEHVPYTATMRDAPTSSSNAEVIFENVIKKNITRCILEDKSLFLNFDEIYHSPYDFIDVLFGLIALEIHRNNFSLFIEIRNITDFQFVKIASTSFHNHMKKLKTNRIY